MFPFQVRHDALIGINLANMKFIGPSENYLKVHNYDCITTLLQPIAFLLIVLPIRLRNKGCHLPILLQLHSRNYNSTILLQLHSRNYNSTVVIS